MANDDSLCLSAASAEAIAAQSDIHAAVGRLVQLYEQLTPRHLENLHLCYAAQAHFKDPFNDVRGLENIRQIFAHMFATLHEPRFTVTEQLLQGRKAFLVWEFRFRMPNWRSGQEQCIRGGTLLHFDDQGLVLDHGDYWDTAEELYEKLPVLGVLMRWLRRKGATSRSGELPDNPKNP